MGIVNKKTEGKDVTLIEDCYYYILRGLMTREKYGNESDS